MQKAFKPRPILETIKTGSIPIPPAPNEKVTFTTTLSQNMEVVKKYEKEFKLSIAKGLRALWGETGPEDIQVVKRFSVIKAGKPEEKEGNTRIILDFRVTPRAKRLLRDHVDEFSMFRTPAGRNVPELDWMVQQNRTPLRPTKRTLCFFGLEVESEPDVWTMLWELGIGPLSVEQQIDPQLQLLRADSWLVTIAADDELPAELEGKLEEAGGQSITWVVQYDSGTLQLGVARFDMDSYERNPAVVKAKAMLVDWRERRERCRQAEVEEEDEKEEDEEENWHVSEADINGGRRADPRAARVLVVSGMCVCVCVCVCVCARARAVWHGMQGGGECAVWGRGPSACTCGAVGERLEG